MIQIFVTGGTFDKEYNVITGELYFTDTHLREMLDIGRCTVEVVITTLMMQDSMEHTDRDREIIVDNCRRCEHERIVITHGTDTMVETAEAIAESATDKTIVLFGAMIPYSFGSSDGFFNLGGALAFVQALPPGVYITMNGQSFAWNEVRKNPKTGIFEPS